MERDPRQQPPQSAEDFAGRVDRSREPRAAQQRGKAADADARRDGRQRSKGEVVPDTSEGSETGD